MEKYLNRCVESLLKNSYRPIEIILVDDGSKDSTPQIVDNLASEHNEIVAIHKPNGGVSSARNAGIEIAKGDYLMFVDPDDYVEPDFISVPVKKAIETNSDLVLFGYKTSWYSSPPIMRDYLPIENLTLTKQSQIFDIVFPRFFGMTKDRFNQWLANDSDWYNGKELPSVWRFVYKRSFLAENSLKFRNLKLGEDATFVWDCLLNAERFSTAMIASYVYIPLQQGALATTTSASKILESKLKILERRNRIAKELKIVRGIDINDLYAGSNIISALQIGFALADNGTYTQWNEYLNDEAVKQSVSNISMNCAGG
ncbi:MAG: glycosyltransferase family 2 protein [Muribaculum sp.]|nr:glycosyltransferase family 2 protein [Muribaculum sp.]